MNFFDKILVCIRDPEVDGRMLEYIAAATRLARSSEVHLLHVLTENREETGPDPSPEVTSETLEQLGRQYLEKNGGCRGVVAVLRGTPLIEILRYAHENSVDLIVLGGDHSTPGHEARLARRVTRKSTCSVLVLPEKTAVRLNRILVPVRDSECSANAVRAACSIAELTGAKVLCLNVFRVHSGHARGADSLEEFTDKLKGLAEEECRSLLGRLGGPPVRVDFDCVPDLYGRTVPLILENITGRSADLVVIGARGRSGAAGVLLGDVTEKLIHQSPVPVLAVKKKGECVGLLEALLMVAGEGA